MHIAKIKIKTNDPPGYDNNNAPEAKEGPEKELSKCWIHYDSARGQAMLNADIQAVPEIMYKRTPEI